MNHMSYTYSPATQKVVPKDAVVLDLDERLRAGGYDWSTVVGVLRLDDPRSGRYTRDAIADQIEAQTRPPRMPEPGRLALVAASCVHNPKRRMRWVHETDGNWYPIGSGENPDDWDSLIDPVLVRPGIEDAS